MTSWFLASLPQYMALQLALAWCLAQMLLLLLTHDMLKIVELLIATYPGWSYIGHLGLLWVGIKVGEIWMLLAPDWFRAGHEVGAWW